MKKLFCCAGVFALLAVPALAGPKKPSAATLARGKYLVEGVGMCSDCHSARNQKGEVPQDQYLKGATLGFKPMGPAPNWANTAVNIAGLPGWEQDAAVKYFMTGIGINNLPARPPMPQYRLNREDAEALVAYLKSLAPK
jgi:mono/diheme cytochrome c family protein